MHRRRFPIGIQTFAKIREDDHFAGNEPLFRGLAIHPGWDWSIPYPVIRLSFGGGVLHDAAALARKIGEQRRINQAALGVTCTETDVTACVGELIRLAHTATGQRAVILVDEYDKPDPRQPDRTGDCPRAARRAAQSLLGHQGPGRLRPVRLHHRGEQIQQGQHLFGA
ncbi:putative AAA-ATPase [Thiocystis violascens DSM 198]|uniref:Putative AAA-ATPase n=1 Tax=Thiocystis violascens (strain ATCC 17096 / DSM 198 / 6111) TaxID=765911 RepID=I3YAG9_THIV6|nr:putative AAA-ATPase [Thiocystis violascens DSM 198]